VTRLLADLEIDAACLEFLAQRIVALGGSHPPQPIVAALDAAPPEDEEPDPDWDELTARAARMCAAPGRETTLEITERLLSRMEE
jgi:hypothetical protein